MNFKISFEKSDFEDDEFFQDIHKIYEYYYNAIVLEYKENKIKENKEFGNIAELSDFIKNNDIKFGNIVFYNFEIPMLKKKFKERNL